MAFDDDLIALEGRVLQAAAGDFLAAVDELRVMLAMQAPGIGRRLAAVAITDFENIIRNGVFDAHALGATQGLADAARLPDSDDTLLGAAQRAIAAAPLAPLVAPVAGLFTLVTVAVAAGVTLLATGSPAEEALGPVFGAANTVKGVTTSQINFAANKAVLVVADQVRAPLVWQAEKDGCVFCLALAGQVVTPGEVFPDSDLYAPQPTGYEPILEPPRHRNCRCTLAVLYDVGYAEALKREAQRSILRGFSLRSESQAVRIRAAARLLARDPDAPKSVKAYAARAVRDGKFPRGREVPAGGPRLVT